VLPADGAAAASAAAAKAPDAQAAVSGLIDTLPERKEAESKQSTALVAFKQAEALPADYSSRTALILKQRAAQRVKPEWHAPWKLMRVISGHVGWVRSVCVDHSNKWFATGSGDRTIKIWDLASGSLKLTLTGHISSVRGLQISKRHPYLFSVSEDKTVKCWDLEYNKVVPSYHGHLSGVFTCNLHPTIDVLMTGGRDAAVRVWDIRTKTEVRVLSGHTHTIGDIQSQGVDPQVISGSHDSTIKCWDLATGRCSSTLTNHKKSVRALRIHHSEYSFASGAADNIKAWKCPEGKFLRNYERHNTIINALALNQDNVLVSGGNNGSINLYDWKSGYNFQTIQSQVQPGSLDSEAGIFATEFDQTGSRLITCETDKTIKIWKEDEEATEESHPINFKPKRKIARY
jgi:pleiotropic regulator 1